MTCIRAFNNVVLRGVRLAVQCDCFAALHAVAANQTKEADMEKKKQLEIKTINRAPKWNAKKAEERKK